MTRVIPGRPRSRKTAISLPGATFERAEAARKRLGATRSELYARALEDFLKAMEVRELERCYEAGYRKKPPSKKELKEINALMQAGLEALEKEIW